MKTLSIGDIHGRDAWKFLTHGSPYEYETWRTAVDAGAAADDADFWKSYPYTQVDKVIFVGDYVDSFKVKNSVMLQNLRDIIHFKKALPDKVVLLLGNHDVQYIVPDQICSGYRPEMQHNFFREFYNNQADFQMAYQVENYLWTHAGVTFKWLNIIEASLPQHRNYVHIFGDKPPITIADKINAVWDLGLESLYAVDSDSGGYDPWAGPLWVRPRVLNEYPIAGVNQIVGHTPHTTIAEIHASKAIHYYIDVLEYGNGDGLYLEINGKQ